jgi:site-specific DNA recombinase
MRPACNKIRARLCYSSGPDVAHSPPGNGVRQVRLDAERAEDAIERAGPAITPQALKTFARTARKRTRTASGGYRRDHLRALAQRVEVDQKELRIMGSKSVLLRALVAAESAKTAGFGVPSSVAKWRATADEDGHYCFAVAL